MHIRPVYIFNVLNIIYIMLNFNFIKLLDYKAIKRVLLKSFQIQKYRI